MPRLVKRDRVVPDQNGTSVPDWMRCCKYCHHFDGERCLYNGSPSKSVDAMGIYEIAEGGRLSEALREVMGERFQASMDTGGSYRHPTKGAFVPLLELFDALGKKRGAELRKAFTECMEQFLDLDLAEHVDERVSVLYQEAADKSGDSPVEIPDPLSYCCRGWC